MRIKKTKKQIPNSGPIFYDSTTNYRDKFINFLKLYSTGPWGSNLFSKASCLQKIEDIKEIKMSRDELQITKTHIEDGCLYLPKCFFRREITSSSDLIQILDEYPDLESLLKSYAIAICSHTCVDTERDSRIKELLAIFCTQDIDSIKEYNLSEKSFLTYSNINPLQCNIILQLVNLLGPNIIEETLKNSVSYLEYMIDVSTEKKGMGKRIVDSILRIDEIAYQEEDYDELENINENIKNKLLKPFYYFLKDSSPETACDFANLIALANYNRHSINLLLGTKYPLSSSLKEEEIETIKTYCSIFDEHIYELIPYYATEFPKLTPKRNVLGQMIYDVKDFTPINKVLTVMNYLKHTHDKREAMLLSEWITLQKTLIFKALPRIATNGNLDKTRFNFDEVIEVSTFYGEKDEFNLWQSTKTKRLEKKVNERI